MKNGIKIGIVGLLMATQVGCYATRVESYGVPVGTTHTDRQWFTVAGLIGLSGPAGRECPNGLASAESKQGLVDILITAGLGVVGGIVGGVACGSSNDPTTTSFCASSGASLATFLLGTRTVTYTCLPGPAATGELLPGQASPPVAAPALTGGTPAGAP